MKYLIISILLLPLILSISSNSNPSAIQQSISITPQPSNLTVIQYFTLAGINKQLKDQQWYAFLDISTPEEIFWINFYVYMSTINKQTGRESHRKVQCFVDHNQLHDCFISHEQIDIEEENLKLQFIFKEQISISIKVEVNNVKTIKLGEDLILRKNDANFTRIIRYDLKDFEQKFSYLQFQLVEQVIVDEYRSSTNFLASAQITPPDYRRYQALSFPFEDFGEMIILDYNEIVQSQQITLLIGLTDINTYHLRSKIIKKTNEVQQIEVGKQYVEVIDDYKNYRIDLPTNRTQNQYYLLRIKINSIFRGNFTDVKINDQKMKKRELFQLFGPTGIVESQKGVDVWIPPKVYSAVFTYLFNSISIYSIQLQKFDMGTIVLKKNLIWQDQLAANQTQYLYIYVQTRTGQQSINMDFETTFTSSEYTINFRNCAEKDIENCKKISKVSNEEKQRLAPIIKTQIILRQKWTIHNVEDFKLTKYQLSDSLYESIIIVQVIPREALIYAITWSIISQFEALNENQLVRGSLKEEQIKIFYFTVLNTLDLAFARVHLLNTDGVTAFGTLDKPSKRLQRNISQPDNIIYQFGGSIVFTDLKDRTTYYIYVMGPFKGGYQLTLTYGYSNDDQINHPISYLMLGQFSKNQLVMQPYQILFIEARGNISTILSIQNTISIKVCQILASKRPSSHQDMKTATYCNTVSTLNTFFIYSNEAVDKLYLGIQNENSKPVPLILTTQNDWLDCPQLSMGSTDYFFTKTDTKEVVKRHCSIYPISHKGQIQISVNLNNPKLKGISQPEISIGKNWKMSMSSKFVIITKEDVENYCEQSYQLCFVKIEIKQTDENVLLQQFVAVSASYTDQPLVLQDGVARHSIINAKQIKHYKFPIFDSEKIILTVAQNGYDSINVYGKLITNEQKFHYPTEQEYDPATNKIVKAQLSGYSYVYILEIQSSQIYSKCIKPQKLCYMLFSIFGPQKGSLPQAITVQVTQSNTILYMETALESYIEKDSTKIFYLKNNNPKQSLLFYTSTKVPYCFSLTAYYHGQNEQKLYAGSGTNEVFIQIADKDFYILEMNAQQNCDFTIKVYGYKKGIAQIFESYGNSFSLAKGQIKSYFLHIQQQSHIKLIASFPISSTSQILIRVAAIHQKSLGDFIKLLNNQGAAGKGSSIAFSWTDLNHLNINKDDKQLCKNCYIYIQIEALSTAQGILTLITGWSKSISFQEYIFYDILKKQQQFQWQLSYQHGKFDTFITLRGGQVSYEVIQAYQAVISNNTLNFDKATLNNNTYLLDFASIPSNVRRYLRIKITALQNTDYSIFSQKKNSPSQQESFKGTFIEIGAQNYFWMGQKPQCFSGILANERNQFLISTGLEITFKKMMKSLEIKFIVNDQMVNFTKQQSRNTLLISYQAANTKDKKIFSICLNNQQADMLYGFGTILYLGNLNYIHQNSQIHLKKDTNITFLSKGKGYIELQQCSGRSTVSLSSDYKDIANVNSKIGITRGSNNLIYFNHTGSVYMHLETKQYVALKWRNYHRQTGNGFGYESLITNTFIIRYDKNTQDFSAEIKPLVIAVDDSAHKFQVLTANYRVVIAQDESGLYNALNCKKGKYMQWKKIINGSQSVKQFVNVKLNNVADLKIRFDKAEYVLVGVKVEVELMWIANQFKENYRFYYPYQQLLLSQFSDNLNTEENNPNKQIQDGGFMLNTTLIVGIVICLIVIATIIFLKRKYKINRGFQDQSSFPSDYQAGTQLQARMKSTYIAPN